MEQNKEKAKIMEFDGVRIDFDEKNGLLMFGEKSEEHATLLIGWWNEQKEQFEDLTVILRQIMAELPLSRDWLDPALEKAANELLKKIKNG